MLFSPQMPLPSLIDLCHTLRHNLDAGIALVKVFQQQAERGPAAVQPVARRVLKVLQRGHDLDAALKYETELFPPLFLSLVRVGERTGNLPEVFGALEAFFRTQHRLKRELRSRSMLPLLQLAAAIFIIAGLIFVLGLIASSNNTKPLDPLGIGLTGTSGAITFLLIVAGIIATVVGGYIFTGRQLQHRAAIDRQLLRVPMLGSCLYALALSRFCLALRVTLETALPMDETLDLALHATGNAAFAAISPEVGQSLRAGHKLAESLAGVGVFDYEFQSIIATGEESGRLPEVMRLQAKHYEEVAEQRLILLTKAAGFAVWLFVAILIIIAIFRIFSMYLGAIQQFT